MPTVQPPRITPHQKSALRSVAFTANQLRKDARRKWYWVDAKYIGSKAALAHLERKGYLTSTVTYGPRGGEQLHYWPTAAGWKAAGHVTDKIAGHDRGPTVERTR